jgi:hypothetical protein
MSVNRIKFIDPVPGGNSFDNKAFEIGNAGNSPFKNTS